MSIPVLATIIISVLSTFFLFLYTKDKKKPLLIPVTLGNKDSIEKQVIAQKLRQQHVAFVSFLVSLFITLILAIYLVVKYTNRETFDLKHFTGVVGCVGGLGTTIGFRYLYKKSTDEINKLK